MKLAAVFLSNDGSVKAAYRENQFVVVKSLCLIHYCSVVIWL